MPASPRPDQCALSSDSLPADAVPAGPGHVAIIMDGNGRWAARRGLPRAAGHRAGVEALKRTVKAAPALGVSCLTVFGFSTENWRRPAEEVSDLMGIVRSFVDSDLERLHREGVLVRVVGRRKGVPDDIAAMIERAERRTAANSRFRLQVAFNYGGRADLIHAARRHAERVLAGEVAPEIDEAGFSALLSTHDAPPLDLIIRTSGEMRLSNFLLWEAAYAELMFQDILWPDYGAEALGKAVDEFRARDRRYGGRPDVRSPASAAAQA